MWLARYLQVVGSLELVVVAVLTDELEARYMKYMRGGGG